MKARHLERVGKRETQTRVNGWRMMRLACDLFLARYGVSVGGFNYGQQKRTK